MTRPKIHGGYTSTPDVGNHSQSLEYWTCGHALTLPLTAKPMIDCPKCLTMTDAELEEMVKSKGLIVEAVEAPA
jgi:hypothetical protein